MKRIMLCLLVGIMMLNVIGCSKETNEPKVEGNLVEIIEKIYGENNKTMTSIKSINDENIEYVLGTDEIQFVEGIVSEPMMSSQPHTVALLRVADDANIEDIKSKIKANVNPAKWVCVSVPEDQIVVDNIGNLVILIMDRESEPFHKNFLSLAK